ncbi:hypothetical protein H310_11786 [Aphanomyces invadans]|uniref:Uncharacterized protein n=1 Tax=Aphanomyces invadans TaxID=157072 RepID=A0A024TMB4_9STRA|nr:hypothetical protein H310_11786 [Aphanomyces invadans]ETV94457.1 hypothetical protein H310_11786 [Aphanomyces invadans]|eukprot:XP_008876772.1 hypothetical protein H310_11786 [Aphanomyces invadans]
MDESVAQCCRQERWEEAIALIEGGASVVEAFGNHQYTALHYAAMHGAVACASLLIAHGCNVNATGKDGLAPLHLSVQNRHKDMTSLLLDSGADIHLGDLKGNQPFLGAPWHSIVYPCLIAPIHDAIRLSIQSSVHLQASNLSLRQKANRLHYRIAQARSSVFDSRTVLFDSRKHRQTIEHDIATTDHDILVTERNIATSEAMLRDMHHDKVKCEALLVETAAATLAKQDESRALGIAHANVKLEEAQVEADIAMIQTHLRDKCETLACISKLSANEMLQEHSFRALAKLCLQSDSVRKLLDNGLVVTVLDGLDLYPKNVSIQKDGTAILFRIVSTTGAIPASHLQRTSFTVSSALVVLRNSSVINYATDANVAAVEAFVAFFMDAAVGRTSPLVT